MDAMILVFFNIKNLNELIIFLKNIGFDFKIKLNKHFFYKKKYRDEEILN
jgi:hypothetical protein